MSKAHGCFSLARPSIQTAYVDPQPFTAKSVHFLLPAPQTSETRPIAESEDSFMITPGGIVTHIDDSGKETTIFLDDSKDINSPKSNMKSHPEERQHKAGNEAVYSTTQISLEPSPSMLSGAATMQSQNILEGHINNQVGGSITTSESVETLGFNLSVMPSQD